MNKSNKTEKWKLQIELWEMKKREMNEIADKEKEYKVIGIKILLKESKIIRDENKWNNLENIK